MISKFHFFILTLLFLIFGHDASAHANCMMPLNSELDKIHTIKIEKSYAPIFDGSGTKHSGCLVKQNGEILGYTPYDYICALTADETVKVKFSPGCCDTGPDQGDLACTVRSKSILGIKSAHGNGVTIIPVEKDKRAILDLMHVMKGDYPFSYYGAAMKLVDYINDPAFKNDVLPHKSDLKMIAENAKKIDQKAMAAFALLRMGGNSEPEDAKYISTILESQPVFKDVMEPALARAKELQSQEQILVPSLISSLKHKYYDEELAPLIFDALESFQRHLKPYMKDILFFEYEWSDRGAMTDFKERKKYYARMNKLACDVSSEGVNKIDRKIVLGNYTISKEPFHCPPAAQ